MPLPLLNSLISSKAKINAMKSIIALAMLLSLVLPSLALSPIEQAYVDGVNAGVKLGKLMSNPEQYNIAVQQYNDNLNQTFGANASIMWLPMMAVNNTADAVQNIDSYTSMKPVHKMDGTQGETTLVQY